MNLKLKKWYEILPGGIVEKAGNMIDNKTGSWRVLRPVINKNICKKCGTCWLICPDIAIKLIPKDKEVEIEIDYDYCKGCGMCFEECPVNAISMVDEVSFYA